MESLVRYIKSYTTHVNPLRSLFHGQLPPSQQNYEDMMRVLHPTLKPQKHIKYLTDKPKTVFQFRYILRVYLLLHKCTNRIEAVPVLKETNSFVYKEGVRLQENFLVAYWDYIKRIETYARPNQRASLQICITQASTTIKSIEALLRMEFLMEILMRSTHYDPCLKLISAELVLDARRFLSDLFCFVEDSSHLILQNHQMGEELNRIYEQAMFFNKQVARKLSRINENALKLMPVLKIDANFNKQLEMKMRNKTKRVTLNSTTSSTLPVTRHSSVRMSYQDSSVKGVEVLPLVGEGGEQSLLVNQYEF